jgi:hypothetical protein
MRAQSPEIRPPFSAAGAAARLDMTAIQHGGSVKRRAFVRGDATASLRMAGTVELGRLQARRAPNLKHKSQAHVASKGDAIAASAIDVSLKRQTPSGILIHGCSPRRPLLP